MGTTISMSGWKAMGGNCVGEITETRRDELGMLGQTGMGAEDAG